MGRKGSILFFFKGIKFVFLKLRKVFFELVLRLGWKLENK